MLAPKLMGICLRYMARREEAEDVLQDSFVKIFTSLSSFRNDGSFEGWAKRITVNTALNALKKKRIEFSADVGEQGFEIAESDEVSPPQLDELLVCLAGLPDGYRTIINLYLVEEYSHKEIGLMLNIRESTSRSQYSRAVHALQLALKKGKQTTLLKDI
jgi:RNA polymerase sigma factor (sigma-70 family)